jgi:hypothetical protein
MQPTQGAVRAVERMDTTGDGIQAPTHNEQAIEPVIAIRSTKLSSAALGAVGWGNHMTCASAKAQVVHHIEQQKHEQTITPHSDVLVIV